MTYVLYCLVAVGATTLGAVTGMGGGVFMKPILDLLGQYDAGSISALSSVTVFVMAAVSVFRRRGEGDGPPARESVPLAIGAAVGGILGGWLLAAALRGSGGAAVTITQNACLAALVILVIVYFRKKDAVRSPALRGAVPAALAGLFLGVSSSFLGIGGGPINVALIVLLFDYPTRRATLCSLITILFSQGAKLLQIALTTGFAVYSLEMLPVMAAGAVAGGLVGARLSRGLDERATDRLFQAAQALVLLLCAVNILRRL